MPVCPHGLGADSVMLSMGPVLPQAQVFDLLGHLTHLQPSLGELQLDVEHLHLVEELVDLH
jgi:hypothetical protein